MFVLNGAVEDSATAEISRSQVRKVCLVLSCQILKKKVHFRLKSGWKYQNIKKYKYQKDLVTFILLLVRFVIGR